MKLTPLYINAIEDQSKVGKDAEFCHSLQVLGTILLKLHLLLSTHKKTDNYEDPTYVISSKKKKKKVDEVVANIPDGHT